MDNIKDILIKFEEDSKYNSLVDNFNTINKLIEDKYKDLEHLEKKREIIINDIKEYIKIEN